MTTDQINEELNKVIVGGDGLVTVAKAVSSLNLSLAHHAAWTEERFDAVDRRFEAVDRRFDAVERVLGDMSKLMRQMDRKLDRVEVRMDQVISFGIRQEMKADDIQE